MKKVIFGSALFMAGMISCAVLLAGTIVTAKGEYNSFQMLSSYGLIPVLIFCACLAAAGFAVAVWGLCDRK